jgi:hypothetical protein
MPTRTSTSPSCPSASPTLSPTPPSSQPFGRPSRKQKTTGLGGRSVWGCLMLLARFLEWQCHGRNLSRSVVSWTSFRCVFCFDSLLPFQSPPFPFFHLGSSNSDLDRSQLIDAAHEVGQQPVSLQTAQPDAWTSNVHKWGEDVYCLPLPLSTLTWAPDLGSAHRAVAILYVDRKYVFLLLLISLIQAHTSLRRRWQHLIHSFPTGASYSVRSPDSTSPNWTSEFVWHSTSAPLPYPLSLGQMLTLPPLYSRLVPSPFRQRRPGLPTRRPWRGRADLQVLSRPCD